MGLELPVSHLLLGQRDENEGESQANEDRYEAADKGQIEADDGFHAEVKSRNCGDEGNDGEEGVFHGG